MIEIIALIFLSRNNGFLAEKKGLKFWTWEIYTIIAWIGSEFLGAVIGIITFGPKNLMPVYILGLVLGVMGYFLVRSILDKMPDAVDENEIKRISIDDLRP